MSSKAVKIMLEVLLAVGVAIGLSFIPQGNWSIHIDLVLIPLVFVALRQGLIWGMGASLLAGGIHLLITPLAASSMVAAIFDSLLAYGIVGVTGLFARNTVRTAFNARISSTVLNLVTASVFASLFSFVFHSIASTLGAPTFYQQQVVGIENSFATAWPYFLATVFLLSVLLVALLYAKRSLFIPKGTRYLSRKERSHLLND